MRSKALGIALCIVLSGCAPLRAHLSPSESRCRSALPPGNYDLLESISFDRSILPALLKAETETGKFYPLQGMEVVVHYKRPQTLLLFQANADRLVFCSVDRPVRKSCSPQLWWFKREDRKWLLEEGHMEAVCVVS